MQKLSKNIKLIVGVVLVVVGLGAIMLYTSRPLTEDERWERRRDAYDYAVQCSGVKFPKVQFEEIMWVVVPGNEIVVEATDGTARLMGYYQIDTKTIWMPDTNKDLFWIMAHESMHAIGYLGHPEHPFRTCRLMADQQP